MTDLHLAIGLLAVAANAAAAAWGTAVVLRRRPSSTFLPLARSAQGVTLVQLLLGILLLTGANADEALPSGAHILAAAGILAALAAAEALGRIPARRQSARHDRVFPGVGLEAKQPPLGDSPPPGIAQTAILAAGFVVISCAAVVAVITGWR